MHPSVYYIILFVFLVHISKCWKKYFISYFILFSFFITTNNQMDRVPPLQLSVLGKLDPVELDLWAQFYHGAQLSVPKKVDGCRAHFCLKPY